ncbi:DNA glycosylase [Lophiotrema nucula]|uniref:Adenine DNA glycosylase n=1 Tax=Lophiotrema nucula TaxID=690887 RepID=A0A6A5YS87_9PLEO|nr:DNA glycosylase [Lophiotrema nucula]
MSTRQKTPKALKALTKTAVGTLGIPEPSTPDPTTCPPARLHHASYHWPLLLADKDTCNALLTWFEGVEEERLMPWRKKWIDPSEWQGKEEDGKKEIARRAYEVWVSEVMLQQTRVSTVIPYFNNWISKWATVQDLANAKHEDVLSVWKGLGYYSRATRLHQGAKDMVEENDKDCPIPSGAQELQKFSGIGRYTAGAISSIAFGEAEPVLDGNVARVLSRQLGLFADVKDKKTSDFLWKVADRLIRQVSGYPETKRSAIPGQWNQALMELGSTICTPKPKCDECPIQKTCRAYAEGQELSKRDKKDTRIPDIEDACSLCEQLDTEDLMFAAEDCEDMDDPKPSKKRKTNEKNANKISQYFVRGTPSTSMKGESTTDNPSTSGDLKRKVPTPDKSSKSLTAYCSLFPKKPVKKKVAEEECCVCIIELRLENGKSRWMIEQRPAKGLLASLWQFPQCTLPASDSSASFRKSSAKKFVSDLDLSEPDLSKAKHVRELGTLTHVFTHLRLTMHVHHFTLDDDPDMTSFGRELIGLTTRKWVDTEAMDGETLSTGMRRCWSIIQPTF